MSFTAPLFSRNALLNAATIHAFTVLGIRLRIQVLTRNASSIENDEIDNPDADVESRAFSMNAINDYDSLTADDWTDGSIDDAAYSASISGDKFMILNVLAAAGIQTAIDKLDAINEILNA